MTYPFKSRLFWSAVVLAAMGAAGPSAAEQPIRKSDKTVVAAFRTVVARPGLSTVKVLCNGKEAALGTVVGEDGWIVTKYSELTGKIVVKTREGATYDATVEGVEDRYDLAMLKVAAKGLKPIEWGASKDADQGDWLAAPGIGDEPVAIGVVSVKAREPKMFEMPAPAPKSNSGFMGIQLADDDGAPKIGSVEPKGAAQKAGLKAGDVVLAVQGEAMSDVEGLIRKIQSFKAGDVIKLKIKREGKEQEIQVTLGKRPANQANRGDIQNSMGSTLSNRKSGFPAILQSDLVIPHTACGGPAVTLDGKAVGVFIARAGRTESYVIPSERVRGLIADLKSGKLKPKEVLPTVNVKDLEEAANKAKSALESKQKALKRAQDDDVPDEEKVKALTDEVNALKKKYEEAQKALKAANGEEAKKEQARKQGK
jgi:serine protease Do